MYDVTQSGTDAHDTPTGGRKTHPCSDFFRNVHTRPYVASKESYLSTIAKGADLLGIVEEAGTRECLAVGVVGGSMLEGNIQGLDGLLWDISSTVSSAVMHNIL
jgi:hypothetical protein